MSQQNNIDICKLALCLHSIIDELSESNGLAFNQERLDIKEIIERLSGSK